MFEKVNYNKYMFKYEVETGIKTQHFVNYSGEKLWKLAESDEALCG